jgi:predicted patatin/cPLA2 family phospholipase
MKSNKTAIVIHGGAIKGAFAAGVAYGLSQIGIKNADIIVGTSSSVPTSAYFASQQFEFISRNNQGETLKIKVSP